MISFSVSEVRQYKGAALSCLVLLALSPLPVAQEWLERNSGYTDKPVSQALSYLAESGRIVHTRSGWHLTDGTVQMALGMVDLLPDEVEKLSTGYPQVIHKMSRKNSESRNNSDSSLIIIKDSIKELTEDFEFQELNNNKRASRNNSDSKPEVWQALARFGIRKNARTEAMVALEHVDLAFVKAVIQRLDAAGRGGARHAGLLIAECEKVPVVVEPVDRCQDVVDKVNAFMRGDK